MDNYGIGVPMNVCCEGTIVLYHRNSIRGNTVKVFHSPEGCVNLKGINGEYKFQDYEH